MRQNGIDSDSMRWLHVEKTTTNLELFQVSIKNRIERFKSESFVLDPPMIIIFIMN